MKEKKGKEFFLLGFVLQVSSDMGNKMAPLGEQIERIRVFIDDV